MSSMFPPVRLTRSIPLATPGQRRGGGRKALHRHREAILCRATAIALTVNLALRPARFPEPARIIGRAYVYKFWRPANAGEWLDIVVAFLIWPFGILACACWYTWKNGGIVAERSGRSRTLQFVEQLKLSVTTGLLPPWYYIFELHRPGELGRAPAFLTRGETKHGAYLLLAEARGSSSPLGDKEEFARFCGARQLPSLPVLTSIRDGRMRRDTLPPVDLFVKPVRGRGGKGAERWDHTGGYRYRHPNGQTLSASQLAERLRGMSRVQPYLVQERARNHPSIADLSNGALNTVRMISCLSEQEQPELIGAVLRMAVGTNVTVDNVHAGGIAAPIDLERGQLRAATYMGIDSSHGWIDRHPDTEAAICGRRLPYWQELCELVRRAHSAFDDWVVIGWDVAIMADGPRLVEGNSGPDIDLVQRPLRMAFGESRLGELLALHLRRSEQVWRRQGAHCGATGAAAAACSPGRG